MFEKRAQLLENITNNKLKNSNLFKNKILYWNFRKIQKI